MHAVPQHWSHRQVLRCTRVIASTWCDRTCDQSDAALPLVSKQLRGIVATFRMTARALPTRPSHYVSMILAPLHQFIQVRL